MDMTIHDKDDGNVIWRGTVEVPVTAYDPDSFRVSHVVYPEGTNPAEILDDLTAPSETDGPQELVDDSELEEEQHPIAPKYRTVRVDGVDVRVYDSRDGSTIWAGQTEDAD